MKWLPRQAICLSLSEKTAADILAQARNALNGVDVLEIRLDGLANPVLEPFFAALTIPLLFTNRPVWEGGMWQGEEEKRLALLVEAVNKGAACVDLELRAPAASWRQIKDSVAATDCTLLTSWHDFTTTPVDEELRDILGQMMASGAEVGKIVTTAHGFTDVLRVLHLQIMAKEKKFPLAAFCMGEAGRISRAATLSLGGVLTYGAATKAAATAPGQLTVAEINEIRRYLHD